MLVPGLWMPAAAMLLMARFFRRAGYAPRVFRYRGRDPLEANIEQLRAFCRRPGHAVGHSLGGVLLLETFSRHRELPLGAAVLIGAPVGGCEAGRRLGGARIGRWMMGASRPLWETRAAAWARPEPLGVIAGTRALGLGRLLGRLPRPNDGVVALSETSVRGMREQATVPLGHSELIFSRAVADLAARFLGHGCFR